MDAYQQPASLLSLPVDVLQQIAESFSTRDWVTGCGSTCKLLSQLQPLQIDVSTSHWTMSRSMAGNVESVIRWTIRHWRDARTIDMTMFPLAKELPPDACPDSLISAMDNAAGQSCIAQALREFRGTFVSELMTWKRMSARERTGTQAPRPLYVSSGPLEALCALILPLMSRLQALNLFISFIPQLPPFQELRNLELHAVKFGGVQGLVSRLTALKTLLLSCEHEEAVMAELDLAQMPRLRRLRLDSVFPKRLALPAGCRFDLSGGAAAMDAVISRGDWADALSKLRACTCVWTIVRKTGLRFHTVSALPAFLSRASSLEELALHGNGEVDFSIVNRVMLSSISLESLWVKSDSSVSLHFPAGLQLRRLRVYSPRVGLRFDNWISSICRWEDVIIMTSIFTLPMNLEEKLIAVGSGLIQMSTGESEGDLGLTLRSLYRLSEADIQQHVHVYRGGQPLCQCGMCWSCLKQQATSPVSTE